MANMETGYQITYTTDFGAVSTFGLRFGADIPEELITTMGYAEREESCGSSKNLKPRQLQTVLTNGNVHLLPVATLGEVVEKIQALNALDIVACINLIGEELGNVPASLIGNPVFTTTPIEGIPDSRDFQPYQYQYTSDIIGQINTATRVEKQPTALATCQIAGLSNANAVDEAICQPISGFKPRRFYIINRKLGGGRVRRQAILSKIADKDTAAAGIAPCSVCAAYQGESMTNVGEVVPAA